MKTIIVILLALILSSCSDNTITPTETKNEYKYTKQVTLLQNESYLLTTDSITVVNIFTDVNINTTGGKVQVIANYGDVDLNCTKLQLENVGFVNVLINNFNDYPVTVYINLN